MFNLEKVDFANLSPYELPIWRRGLIKVLLKFKNIWKDDKSFLTVYYLLRMGKKMHWNNPQSFTEKLTWLKVNNRKPIYTEMVDKYLAKKLVKNKIGEEYVIRTYGVWNSFDEIDFSGLPNQFVIKTTHGGGSTGVVVCKDKKNFNIDTARNKINKSLAMDLYTTNREWPYKNVERRIIVEEYIEDGNGRQDDYKIFCFNGKVQFLKIVFDNETGHHANFYDRNWELQNFFESDILPDDKVNIPRPLNFDKMIEIAEKLSRDLPFLRVDLYNLDGKIYFGEMTFYPARGMDFYSPQNADKYIGELLLL